MLFGNSHGFFGNTFENNWKSLEKMAKSNKTTVLKVSKLYKLKKISKKKEKVEVLLIRCKNKNDKLKNQSQE